ncbi:MAG: hypothetical protein AAFR51_06660 [Pseudomonadota bacterium]
MTAKQPAEFGENGTVINTPDMTPARKDSYSGINSDDQNEVIEFKWWSFVPAIALSMIGPKVINHFADEVSTTWRLGLYGVVLLISAAITYWLLQQPGARK